MKITCSWCHAVNDVSTRPTLCRACGHRAGLARMDCDCPRCRPQTLEAMQQSDDMPRKGWTRLRGGCGGIWKHDSGWQVRHCGHPTALWPYYGVSPSGETLLAPNGYAFRRLILAQVAVEEQVARKT